MRRLGAIAVAAVLLVVACGDDDDSATTAPANDGGADATARVDSGGPIIDGGASAEAGAPTSAVLSVGWTTACAIPAGVGGAALECWGNGGEPFVAEAGQKFVNVSIAHGLLKFGIVAIRSDGTIWDITGPTGATAIDPAHTYKSVSSIATGDGCGVTTAGALYCWAPDDSSETDPPPIEATQVGVATNWSRVVSASDHNCALDDQGGLWCWGHDLSGDLGTGAPESKADLPVQITAGSKFIDVAVADWQTCAVRDDGSLLCNDATGHLAPFDTDPTWLTKDWTKVTLRNGHLCGLKQSGAMVCFGSNRFGEEGQAPSGDILDIINTPTAVGTDTDWVDVGVGEAFTCGLKRDGRVLCFGSNGHGELGQPGQSHAAPTLIAGDWKYVAVADDDTTVCAVKTDSTLWCWGYVPNNDSNSVIQQSPVQIGTATTWDTISTTGSSACGTQTGGALYCFGKYNDTATPTALGFNGVTKAVIGGGGAQCVLTDTGTLYCWGENTYGQLFAPTTTANIATPTAVTGTWKDFAMGFARTCGIQSDGAMYCSGLNFTGTEKVGTSTSWTVVGADQSSNYGLQNGTAYQFESSDQAPNVLAPSITDWKTFIVSSYGECGIRADGSLWCIRESDLTGTPLRVGTATDWTQVTAATSFACGLRGHALYCWGSNEYGVMADGTAFSAIPLVVPMP